MERVVSYAEVQFKMFTKDAKGNTLYSSLKVAEKAGIKPKELIEYENTLLPSDCAEIWQDYLELSLSRSHTADGPCGLTYNDLVAWMSLSGKKLNSFQSDVLLAVDATWLSNFYKNKEKISKQQNKFPKK